jgi:hypothetical protein
VLLAAEQSGWENAAINAHLALRTPSYKRQSERISQGSSHYGQGAGMGQSASPNGLTHGMRLLTLGEGANAHPATLSTHERRRQNDVDNERRRKNKIFMLNYTCCRCVCQAACGTGGTAPRLHNKSSCAHSAPPKMKMRSATQPRGKRYHGKKSVYCKQNRVRSSRSNFEVVQ